MEQMMGRVVLFGVVAVIAIACGPQAETPREEGVPEAVTGAIEVSGASGVEVQEAFLTAFDPVDNIDSVAPAPGYGWVVATAKETHQLVVYSSETGETVRRVGAPGEGEGQFLRPNGIAVRDDLVFVVERDNHRLQVLRLPNFECVALIGSEVLERPYGIDLYESAPGTWEAYVTDNFELGEDPTAIERLDQRVKHFRITDEDSRVSGEHVASFGDLSGQGALMKVETLMLDPEAGVVLVADEREERMSFKLYDLAGTYTGFDVQDELFSAEPEGLALWQCGETGGYWIATDQHKDRSRFHVLDRLTFELIGTFHGAVVANTDGVTLTRESSERFPEGAFYAVHDDQGVGAFDLREIASAVGLEAVCQER